MTRRVDRLVAKRKEAQAAKEDNSTLDFEKREEENLVHDSIIQYEPPPPKPLKYTLPDGEVVTVPAYAESGEVMTYHDQYYQITRRLNGHPIEAKTMCEYRFDLELAKTRQVDDRVETSLSEEMLESEEYKAMRAAHEAQHPPEEKD